MLAQEIFLVNRFVRGFSDDGGSLGGGVTLEVSSRIWYRTSALEMEEAKCNSMTRQEFGSSTGFIIAKIITRSTSPLPKNSKKPERSKALDTSRTW
jgi:hypothetical protein